LRYRSAGLVFFLLVVGAVAVACNGGGSGLSNSSLPATQVVGNSASTPIKHVIIVIQENRSFDNFFATFPGASGTTTGQAIAMPSAETAYCAKEGQQVITRATTVPLTEVSLLGKGFPTTPPTASATGKPFGENQDPPYEYLHGYLVDCNSPAGRPSSSSPCDMNGFDTQKFGPNAEGPGYTCTYLYQYVNPTDIAPYWDMAKQYVLADNAFQSQGSESFTAHQDLIAAGTDISSTASAIDNPTGFPWGCDIPPGASEPYITTQGKYVMDGPRPCYPAYSSYSYSTLRDLLDQHHISWKFYSFKVVTGPPAEHCPCIWSAFDAIQAVRYGKEWGTKVVWPANKKFFADVKNGTLPAVSWITPDAANSDHPAEAKDTGPSWVASIVNAVGESTYWKSSAIVVLWDDFGGFYDHVTPPKYDDQGGLGFRIPLLIISPYVQAHVEHTQYESASVLRFVEDNWKLGTLGKLDKRAKGLENAFDFSMAPRSFKKISAKYPESFFLNQTPSGLAPDNE
jgi:phospholipase C